MRGVGIVLLCGCLGMGVLSALADELVMRDASSWKGKVVEVRPDKILFRKSSESFDREVSVVKVFKIKYDNGTEEIMESTVTNVSPSSPSSPSAGGYTSPDGCIVDGRYVHVSTRPDWSQLAPAERSYAIGDWFDENGLQGIVVEVEPGGRHGKILSPLSNRKGGFESGTGDPIFKGSRDIPMGTNDVTNGYANLQKLLAFRTSHPEFSDSMFPILQYLARLGEGWYVPAIDELEYLCRLLDSTTVYHGPIEKLRGKKVKWLKVFNAQMKAHDAKKIKTAYLMSSTEDFSQGGGGGYFSALFGDPDEPQFVVFKYNDMEKIKQHTRRDFPYPTVALHLF